MRVASIAGQCRWHPGIPLLLPHLLYVYVDSPLSVLHLDLDLKKIDLDLDLKNPPPPGVRRQIPPGRYACPGPHTLFSMFVSMFVCKYVS